MRVLLQKAVEELERAGCETPQLDAEVLLAHALGCERYQLYATLPRSQAPQESWDRFQNFIQRRKSREPVAYITGFKEFWSLPIKITRDVLIPRPETEALVEKSLGLLKHRTWNIEHRTILDLCTGSGCIAAALAKELPQAQFTVTDISEKALAAAKENLAFAEPRVRFVQSDLFEKIEGSFDCIVSNPPYVPTDQWETLQAEIREYEPRLALDGGPQGLAFISKILQDAPRFLKTNGWLVLENGAKIEVHGK